MHGATSCLFVIASGHNVTAKWWNYDADQARTKTLAELFAELRHGNPEEARETLEHVEAIAQSAVDRAAAADRRASTIAGTVAIAASFTLSGSALILDNSKLADKTVRLWVASQERCKRLRTQAPM
jgi:hypothetical protein